MNPPNLTVTPAKRPIYRRRWFVASLILVLLLGTLLVALPLGINHGMKSWLLENGVTGVEIENVDFNPFTGTLLLRGLRATGKDQAGLALPALDGDLEWAPLWGTRVHIQALVLKDARVSIERSDTGTLTVGGIHIPESRETEAASAPDWGFAVDRLQIIDSEIRYRDPQLETTVHVRQLELSDLASWNPEQAAKLSLEGTIDQAELRIQGSLSPFAASPGFSGRIHLNDLRLETFFGAVRSHLTTLRGGLFVDSSFDAGLNQNGDLSVAQKGVLSLADLQVAASAGEFNYQRLAWDGQLNVKVAPETDEVSLAASGRLAQGAASVKLAQTSLGYEDAGLSWQGKIQTLLTPATIRLEMQGDFEHSGLDLSLPAASARLQNGRLLWQGDLTLVSSAESVRLTTEGALTGNGLALSLPGRDLALNQASLEWTGKAGYGLADGRTQLETRGDLNLGELLLDAPQHKQELLAFDRLALKDIHIQSPQLLDVAAITFENLRFAKRQAADEAGQDTPPAVLQSKRSHLSDILYSESEGLYVKRVEHQDIHATIRRTPTGEFDLVGVIDILIEVLAGDTSADVAKTDEGEQKSPSPAAESGAAPQPVRVRADEILAVGESSLTFADDAVTPPYQARLAFNKLQIGMLDTARPEQSSPFELSAIIGKYAQLNVKGSARFFAERISGDITGRLDALELPPLSPYTASALGYNLTSGQMDADIDIHIKEGKLSGTNRLQIHELEVAKLDPEQMEKLGPKSTLPLETGLTMLRNSEDTIELELPIGGDLNNPEFDPTDAINQALAEGMQQGARTYLTAALFPFGTLITVAEVAGKSAMEIRLDPVVFAAASTTLDTTAREYLQKVAKVLEEKPEIDIKICGIAVEDDRETLIRLAAARLKAEAETKRRAELRRIARGEGKPDKEKKTAQPAPISDKQLKNLAGERAAEVKGHLIKEQRIKANRLIACRAQIDKKESEGKPRADLLL